jgi:hypothetical protein
MKLDGEFYENLSNYLHLYFRQLLTATSDEEELHAFLYIPRALLVEYLRER